MAAHIKSFHINSPHSKNTSSSQTSNMQQNLSIEREELLKALLIRKTIIAKGNVMETKPPFTDSKKTSTVSNYNQGGKELLKVVRKGTEKLSIKESKCKNSKMCFCSPTTHEGSFRCRLHRMSVAAKKSSSTEKNNMRMCSKRAAQGKGGEFKPQLSRFGKVASAEVGSHDNRLA